MTIIILHIGHNIKARYVLGAMDSDLTRVPVTLCSGKKVRLDLRGDPVPLRRVLHSSVLQICKGRTYLISYPPEVMKCKY